MFTSASNIYRSLSQPSSGQSSPYPSRPQGEIQIRIEVVQPSENRTNRERRLSPQDLKDIQDRLHEINNREWMKTALIINTLAILGFTIYLTLYTSGIFTFDVFTGSIGPGIALTGAMILSLVSGATLFLGFNSFERRDTS